MAPAELRRDEREDVSSSLFLPHFFFLSVFFLFPALPCSRLPHFPSVILGISARDAEGQ